MKVDEKNSFVYIYIYIHDEEFLILSRIDEIYFKKNVSEKNVRVSAARRPQIWMKLLQSARVSKL